MKKREEIKARLMREPECSTTKIEVLFPGGKTRSLYEGIIAHCARELSINEIRKVLKNCEAQMRELGAENVPLVFEEMVNDLRDALTEREQKLKKVQATQES